MLSKIKFDDFARTFKELKTAFKTLLFETNYFKNEFEFLIMLSKDDKAMNLEG